MLVNASYHMNLLMIMAVSRTHGMLGFVASMGLKNTQLWETTNPSSLCRWLFFPYSTQMHSGGGERKKGLLPAAAFPLLAFFSGYWVPPKAGGGSQRLSNLLAALGEGLGSMELIGWRNEPSENELSLFSS